MEITCFLGGGKKEKVTQIIATGLLLNQAVDMSPSYPN